MIEIARRLDEKLLYLSLYFFAYSEHASTTTWWTFGSFRRIDYHKGQDVNWHTFQFEGSFVHIYCPIGCARTTCGFERITRTIVRHHTVFQARILHTTWHCFVLRKNDVILRWTRTLSVGFVTGIVQRKIQESWFTIAHPGAFYTVTRIKKHVLRATVRYRHGYTVRYYRGIAAADVGCLFINRKCQLAEYNHIIVHKKHNTDV